MRLRGWLEQQQHRMRNNIYKTLRKKKEEEEKGMKGRRARLLQHILSIPLCVYVYIMHPAEGNKKGDVFHH